MDLLALITSASTVSDLMRWFNELRKGKKGDTRAIIEELKENSRLCARVVFDNVPPSKIIPKLSTTEFDRLNKSGFNFNKIKKELIPSFSAIQNTDLASWPGKTSEQLIINIYDKIKNVRSIHEFTPEKPTIRRLIINIHKRISLLLRHAHS